jgi:hypothetical protein
MYAILYSHFLQYLINAGNLISSVDKILYVADNSDITWLKWKYYL